MIKRLKETKWLGSTKCDFCKKSVVNSTPYFVDGRTINGPWALMCYSCFHRRGVGLGLGRGQAYNPATLEKMAFCDDEPEAWLANDELGSSATIMSKETP